VEFRRRRPTPQTLDWVASVAGGRVVAWRRMTGGVASVVHRLAIDRGGRRDQMVLRQYERDYLAHMQTGTSGLITDEAAILRAVHRAGLPAPEPIAADPDGRDCGGHPAILMSRLPGRLDLTPEHPESWLRQIAAMAPRIHSVQILNPPPFRSRIDAPRPVVPASAVRPAIWEDAFAVLRQPPPEPAIRFIHRDFQHFNLLWRRGRLTGVVDWATSCEGPADFDLGHCRLNLAVLFGPDWSERFRLAYEAEAGRAADPWWELYAITGYSDGWRSVIARQAAGRAEVDAVGMTARVEDLIAATLARL